MAMQKVTFEVQRIELLDWMFYVAEKIDLLSNCQTNNNNSFCFSCLLTIIIEQLDGMNCTTYPITILHNQYLHISLDWPNKLEYKLIHPL